MLKRLMILAAIAACMGAAPALAQTIANAPAATQDADQATSAMARYRHQCGATIAVITGITGTTAIIGTTGATTITTITIGITGAIITITTGTIIIATITTFGSSGAITTTTAITTEVGRVTASPRGQAACEPPAWPAALLPKWQTAQEEEPADHRRPHDTASGVFDRSVYGIYPMLVHDFHFAALRIFDGFSHNHVIDGDRAATRYGLAANVR